MFNNLKNKEQEELLPEHIGIIMDGNGRWAKQKGKPRIFGHKAGMDSLKDVAVHGARRGIKVMTVYAFSTENWTRPVDEVKFIMSLPIDFYSKYVPVLKEENIQNIKADVLLFQAGKDTFVKPNGHNKFVSLAKNCEFVRFEDAKHEIYIEKDEIFNPYIEKVLGFYDK